MSAFYTAFNTWAKTATEADVLAILESDADVETMTATKFDVTSDDHLKDAKSFKPCEEEEVDDDDDSDDDDATVDPGVTSEGKDVENHAHSLSLAAHTSLITVVLCLLL
jgi:hypothetical protein